MTSGLGWGRIEDTPEMWRRAHSRYCGGRLVQLIGPAPEPSRNREK